VSENVFIQKDNPQSQGRLLRYLRKSNSIKQSEMAELLNVSQSMISKLENGTLDLDFKTWVIVQREFKLSTYDMAYGYVDSLKPLQNKSSIDSKSQHQFRIPSRYAKLPGSSARSTRPIIELVFQKLGYNNAISFFKNLKVDICYFCKMDNPISGNYHLDVAKLLIDKKILNKKTLKELRPMFQMENIHGSLENKYKKNVSAAKSIEQLIGNANKYEIDKFYEVHDKNENSLLISVMPNKCIDNMDLKDPEVGNYQGLYFKNYLNSYLDHFIEDNKTSHKIEILESYTDPKHSRWLYQVQL
jgi:DNA-binding XRE family transcriptional regulator